MNPIEQEVRDMLRTKVAQAPVRDEPPPVVLRRTKTLRAVNGVGIMAAAAAVVLGIVLGAQTFGDRNVVEPTTPGKPIPWADLPADHPGESARPCNVVDVDFFAEVSDARHLYFRPATAATICSFTFDPKSIRASDASTGRDLGVRVKGFGPTRVDLGGGQGGFSLPYLWSNYCETTPVAVHVALSDGRGVLRAPEVATAVPAGSGPSRPQAPPGACVDRSKPPTMELGGTGSYAVPSEELDPAFRDVTFSLKAPSPVRRDTTLRYEVIMTNNTDTDIALAPCPIYSHAVVGEETSEPGGGPFYLNCDAAPDVIPARGRLVFQIEISGFKTTGRRTLLWSLQTMPSISVPIQIV